MGDGVDVALVRWRRDDDANGSSGRLAGLGEEASSVGFHRRAVAADDDGSADDGRAPLIAHEAAHGAEERAGAHVYAGVHVLVDDRSELVLARPFLVVHLHRQAVRPRLHVVPILHPAPQRVPRRAVSDSTLKLRALTHRGMRLSVR